MKIYNLADFFKGWFVGNFDPSVFKTESFEVAYHEWEAGASVPLHYHKKAVEINLVTYGLMIINNRKFYKGDLFVIEPYEVAEAEFLEDTGLVIIKVPSVLDDKYVVKPV